MLPDLLKKNLKIVFVGANPGQKSDRIGHYYAHPTNHFWSLLYESGIVPTRLTPEEDSKVLDFGIGLTDVVRKATRRAQDATKLINDQQILELEKKINLYRPKIICFNGKTAYQFFSGKRDFQLGLQHDKLFGSILYIIPQTSGLNASYSYRQKLEYLRKLKQLCDDS